MGCYCVSVTHKNVDRSKDNVVQNKEPSTSITDNGKRVYFTGKFQNIVNKMKTDFAELNDDPIFKQKINNETLITQYKIYFIHNIDYIKNLKCMIFQYLHYFSKFR